MDKKKVKETIGEVVCQVLEQTAFMFPEPADLEEGLSFDAFDFVMAKLSFHGDQSGGLTLIVPVEFCSELATNMLGEEIEESDPAERNMDALKEALNIIAGQLLTRVFGDELIFNISSPEAAQLPREEFFRLISENEYACCMSDEYPIISFFNSEERPHEHSSAGNR